MLRKEGPIDAMDADDVDVELEYAEVDAVGARQRPHAVGDARILSVDVTPGRVYAITASCHTLRDIAAEARAAAGHHTTVLCIDNLPRG